MNKSKAGGRVANQIGISGATPANAVAAVLKRIAEALSRGEDFWIDRLGALGTKRCPVCVRKTQRIGGSMVIPLRTRGNTSPASP